MVECSYTSNANRYGVFIATHPITSFLSLTQKKHETADDEAEREFLERKLSQGKPSNNPYGSMSRQRRVANATMDRCGVLFFNCL